MPSPTPIAWIGRPKRSAAATSTPPRAVPSSLVITRPVTPAMSRNTSTWFSAFEAARAKGTDVLIIDTAGRLQNKAGLMDELAKVRRVLKKLSITAPHDTVLVLDATTGQNGLGQVEVFKQVAGVTGLVMTKLDGTARGGVLVAAAEQFGLPIHAIGVGEGMGDLRSFDAAEFANALAGVAATR